MDNSDEKRISYVQRTSPTPKCSPKLPPIKGPVRLATTEAQEDANIRMHLQRDTITEEFQDDTGPKINIKDLFLGNFSNNDAKKKVSLEGTLWEYVIVVENPDYDIGDQSEVTLEEAEQCYKNCFKPRKHLNNHKQALGFLSEINSFVDCFNTLENHEEGKKLKNGGKLVKGPNDEFLYNSGPPKDFLSLVTNAIVVKLVSDLNLSVKSLLSSDGRYIFLIISGDDEDLAKEAERIRYHKQLEFALTDLVSLIPCDDLYRPFHLLKFDDPECHTAFKSIKEFLYKALGLTKNIQKVNYKYDPVGVSPVQLEAYKIFLGCLAQGISKIQQSVSNSNHQMVLLKTLLKDSLDRANFNLNDKDRLKNLWDRLEIPKPLSPNAEYRRPQASSEDELSNLWRNYTIDESGKRSLFKQIERINLLCSLIYTQVSLNALEDRRLIVAHFPLHKTWKLTGKSDTIIENVPPDEKMLQAVLTDFKSTNNNVSTPLIPAWKTGLFGQRIPLSKIRNYFGEKITMYFEFLRLYQISLLLPAIIGIVVFAIQKSFNEDNPAVLTVNAFYCIFITMWATVFLEQWKRRESSLAVIWGQTEFEKLEISRPQFKGSLRRSPITDDMEEVFYENTKRWKFFILSCTVTIAIICMVLAIVAGLIILRTRDTLIYNGSDYLGTLCSLANAVQILIFNFIYSKLVKMLTEMENHKTQGQYEDSLVLKTFAFQFVNAFNSLFYIAFVKCQTDSNNNGTCMNELYVQLISIFLVSYAKNLIELGLPYGKYLLFRRLKRKSNAVNIEKDQADIRNDIEGQLFLDDYVNYECDGTIEDYMELAVQFGYLSMFSLAFPLALALVFVGLWLEMLTDKIKLLKLVRRPIPLACKDIGVWAQIFSAICALSVLSNTALFCFTAPTFTNWKAAQDNSYLIFVIVVAFLLILRSQLMSWIPDVEEKYQTVQRRHEVIVEKYLRGSYPENTHEDIEMFDTNLYYCKLNT